MADTTWEKPRTTIKLAAPKRTRFAIAAVILFGAVAFLIISGTINGGRYFYTIDEVMARPDLTKSTVRLTGAVVGSTIKPAEDGKSFSFQIANVTNDATELEKEGGLAQALHLAVNNPAARRISVVVSDQPLPDLLKDEAQAIVTGKFDANGVFQAEGSD